MAQSKILLDTSSYLRLARSIHPLLSQEFGAPRFCCYVLNELDEELGRSGRLRTSFAWALEEEYRVNRARKLTIGRRDRNAIHNANEFIWETVQSEQAGLSRVDALCLAHGFALGIPVVTDDESMVRVADAFQLDVMRSLDLMKLMLDHGRIEMTKVREMVAYWRYAKDAPADLAGHVRRLFGEGIP